MGNICRKPKVDGDGAPKAKRARKRRTLRRRKSAAGVLTTEGSHSPRVKSRGSPGGGSPLSAGGPVSQDSPVSGEKL